jgi:hypothetical protein
MLYLAVNDMEYDKIQMHKVESFKSPSKSRGRVPFFEGESAVVGA